MLLAYTAAVIVDSEVLGNVELCGQLIGWFYFARGELGTLLENVWSAVACITLVLFYAVLLLTVSFCFWRR